MVTKKNSPAAVETLDPAPATYREGEGAPASRDDAQVDAWARAAVAGDEAAVEALVRRFERPLRVLGMRLLSADLAADLAQEVFCRMILSLKTFRGEARFSTWLFGIAYRTAQGMRRRARRPAEQAAPLSSAPDPSAGGDLAEEPALRAAVEWALSRIRPQHRDAVTLYYLNELSLAEVAAVMGVPEATAKVYLFRGRRELHDLLEREGGFAP